MVDLNAIRTRLSESPRHEAGRVLAATLGWGEQNTSYLEQSGDWTNDLSLVRTFYRGEPAVLFGTSSAGADVWQNDRLLGDAAVAAYHASIDWGVLVGPDGLTVFHSRWIRNRDWYRLPHLSWASLEPAHELLEGLSPDGLTTGSLQRFATQNFYAADEYLRPVDEELVRRLDDWRHRALAIAPITDGVDEALQLLFAQFFVLRAVEDRGLARGLKPLSEALTGRLIDRATLRAIFDEAKVRVQSELFAETPRALIADEVVAGVINDLYVARHLPIPARYNFAWLDADVLGRAYEKYLSRVLEALPYREQGDFFGNIRHIREIDVRRQEGVYYTPSFLVRSLVAQAIDPVIENGTGETYKGLVTPRLLVDRLTATAIASEPNAAHGGSPSIHPLPYVADFACGSGGFLVAAADYLLRRLRELDGARAWAHELVTGQHIVGIDKDPRAVTLTRLNLYIRLTSEPESLPLPSLDKCVVQGDSLGREVWDKIPTAYDAVLGNPPFLATENQLAREELVRVFETAQGRFDFAYLFVELALRKLRPHGVLSLVVPNRLFRNRDAGPIRSLLTSQADLLCVSDFGAQEVFKGVSAYIGTLTARKRVATDSEAPTCRVVNVRATDEVAFLGALLTRAAEEPGEIQNDVLEAFDIPHPRGSSPWLLLSPKARARRLSLTARSVLLGEIAVSRQGIRTGANDIFILVVDSSDGEYARVTNLAGDSATLEAALLRPVVFGTEIQRFDALSTTRCVLYPYLRGFVVEESELRERYPKTFDYLTRYREPLAERGSLVKSGGRWYELIWKRDQQWLDRPKLVIRDLVMECAFAIDEGGGIYLVGGTAIVPAEPASLWPLLGYLNTRVVWDFLRQATPSFRGGFQKVEPRHLDAIPVPLRLIKDASTADAIGGAAKRAVRAKIAKRAGELQEAELEIERIVEVVLGSPIEVVPVADDADGDDTPLADSGPSLPFAGPRLD